MGNKTKLQMRADLRLDLKDSGALWSDDELNRSIERAFSDLSRFLPDEKIYEDSHQFAVADESVTFPKDTDTDAIVADEDLSTASAGDTLTDVEIDGQPDVPRPLTLTLTDASDSVQGMTIIINGLDKDDQALQEVFHYSIGDSKTIAGKKYFKTVYLIEIDQIAGNSADDVLDIGYGAYSDVWVYLANSPIKWQSDTGVDSDDVAIVRNTDYYIDYANGRVKAISEDSGLDTAAQLDESETGVTCDATAATKLPVGTKIRIESEVMLVTAVSTTTVTVTRGYAGSTAATHVTDSDIYISGIAPEIAYLFDYKKSQIGIDISDLPDLIRVQRVEYPVGRIPQNFVQGDTFGKYYVVTGMGESEEQQPMAEGQQYRIYYDAQHQVADRYSPGTEPSFLTNTVLMAAAAYALYILALKQEHQAVTDIASARTSLTAANSFHTQLQTALTNVKKYLDNNNTTDAAGLIDDVNNDAEAIKVGIEAALAALKDSLDDVDSYIGLANNIRESYLTTTNYVTGGTEPDILAYLTAGDALLNEVAKGGEGQDVPRAYAEYARAVKDSLVATFENDIGFYLQKATNKTNVGMVYAQEVAQRLSHLRSLLEQSAAYVAISNTFIAEAQHRGTDIVTMLQQASQYAGAAAADMASGDRFKAEADERRNEVYSIWKDRKQYIGDFTAGSMRQMPDYK